jgi:soluble lytic murein transglycosylase
MQHPPTSAINLDKSVFRANKNAVASCKASLRRFESIAPTREIKFWLVMALYLVTSHPLGATAGSEIYQVISPKGDITLTNVPTEDQFVLARRTTQYPRSIFGSEVAGAVRRAASAQGLQPALLLAVIKAESSFNPMVVSRAGAVGLMQLIPETAIRHGVQNLYDTEDNISGGARHLRYLLDRFHGNMPLALAAYNAGESTIDRYGKVPPYKETRLYVQKVMAYYREYKKGGWIFPAKDLAGIAVMARAY